MTTDQPQGNFVPPGFTIAVQKIASTQLFTREALGLVDPPTDEEREAAHRRKVEAWRLYDAARPALAAITEPVTRAILDLHHADEVEFPKCKGCDFGGYEAEEPEWPCRTVQAVAAQHGIELPDAGYLWRRP